MRKLNSQAEPDVNAFSLADTVFGQYDVDGASVYMIVSANPSIRCWEMSLGTFYLMHPLIQLPLTVW